MLIWILSADISFAVHLKECIRNELKKPKTKLKIEIFHDVPSFFEQVLQVARKKKTAPDLVFLETALNDESTLEVIDDEKCADLADAFIYCSSMSYGLFQEFYERQGTLVPFFVQKQRIDQELKNILDDLQSREESGSTPQRKPGGGPKSRLNKPRLKALLECQRDLYYKGGLGKESLGEFLSHLDVISGLASAEGFEKLGEKSRDLALFMTAEPPPGALRLKREIREFLGAAEKVMGEIE